MALTATTRTFRDAVRKLSPSWLQNNNGWKLMYALALHLDVVVDMVTFGVWLRFPNRYSPDSLGVIGRDRRIRRGPSETDEAYGNRLCFWLDDHRRRGNPYALLAQNHAYWEPTEFQMDMVYRSGRRFIQSEDGTEITVSDVDWSNFDSIPAKWARWFLFFYWPTTVHDDGMWGSGGLWGLDNGVWGSDLTVQQVADIRAVPRDWNAQHALGEVILLNAGKDLWGYPAGTWGDSGVWGSVVRLGVGT
jgi:hypothetical protein